MYYRIMWKVAKVGIFKRKTACEHHKYELNLFWATWKQMQVRENYFSMCNLNSVFNYYKTGFLSCLFPSIYFSQLLITYFEAWFKKNKTR